jgi:hypothetical protein
VRASSPVPWAPGHESENAIEEFILTQNIRSSEPLPIIENMENILNSILEEGTNQNRINTTQKNCRRDKKFP